MTAPKRAEQWRWLCYFDSESSLDREKDDEKIYHDPRLICSTFIDRERGTRTELDFDGPGLCENFYKRVSDSVYAHTTLYLVAHNIGYDLLATGGYTHLVKLGWKVESLYEKGFTYILKLAKEDRRKIICVSSTQFWSAPLRDVAKTFGTEKLESIGHAAADPEQLRIYCRRDVEIIEKAMEWLQAFIHENDLGSMALTLPSLSSKVFRHRFMPWAPVIHNYEPALLLERAAYHGGRTEAWFIGELNETVYKLDVNSLYPFVMREFPHPYSLDRLYPEGSIELIDACERSRAFAIADVSVDIRLPKLPLYRDKLLFPAGKFSTVLTSHEIRLLEPGELTAVRAVAVYKQAPIFRDFIDYFYAERLKAKRDGNAAADELFKRLMNSHYGKYGQRSTEWVRVGDAPPDLVKQELFVLPDGTSRAMRCFGGSTWLNDGAVMESFESFPAIAASVTSAARAHLWGLIQIAGRDNVFYMDTDSLFVNEVGHRALGEFGSIDATKLGALKLEDTAGHVVIRSPKNYLFGKERKFKGIPKDAKLVMEDGEEKAVVWTWPKIATWLREGNLSGFHNKAIKKTTRAAPYDKGVVKTTGRVEAFVLDEQ